MLDLQLVLGLFGVVSVGVVAMNWKFLLLDSRTSSANWIP